MVKPGASYRVDAATIVGYFEIVDDILFFDAVVAKPDGVHSMHNDWAVHVWRDYHPLFFFVRAFVVGELDTGYWNTFVSVFNRLYIFDGMFVLYLAEIEQAKLATHEAECDVILLEGVARDARDCFAPKLRRLVLVYSHALPSLLVKHKDVAASRAQHKVMFTLRDAGHHRAFLFEMELLVYLGAAADLREHFLRVVVKFFAFFACILCHLQNGLSWLLNFFFCSVFKQ